MNPIKNNNTTQPFITWVGGKRRLANILSSYIPDGLNNYYEPFLGGGALFFNVHNKFKRCFLSDINLELVTSYNALKDNSEQVNELLDNHEQQHSKEYFYRVRDAGSNNDPKAISARFIYLNRYSFRGIYRINKNGNSTASFSSKTYTKKITNKLKESSKVLNKATIYANDFSFIEAQQNDFVYFDPPYHESGENFYTRTAFGEADQIRLHNFANELTKRGVKVMLSNSDTKFIRDLYSDFNISDIEQNYAIRENKQISKELIITNYINA